MEEPEVDFTPLIDVTFLLLIFFMVTTTMAQPTSVKLPRASSGKGEITEDKVLVHILEGDDDSAQLRLGLAEETPLSFSNLEQELKSYPNAQSAMIRADEDIDFSYVDKVASRLRALGLDRVVLGVKERNFIKK